MFVWSVYRSRKLATNSFLLILENTQNCCYRDRDLENFCSDAIVLPIEDSMPLPLDFPSASCCKPSASSTIASSSSPAQNNTYATNQQTLTLNRQKQVKINHTQQGGRVARTGHQSVTESCRAGVHLYNTVRGRQH